jgi:hypothetical protein
MIRKMAAFGAVMAVLSLPTVAFTQDLSRPVKSIEDLSIADIANNTIVLISQEETDMPGYVHVKYAVVDSSCSGRAAIVDYYGATIDPKDPNLRSSEQKICTDLQFYKSDGE